MFKNRYLYLTKTRQAKIFSVHNTALSNVLNFED